MKEKIRNTCPESRNWGAQSSAASSPNPPRIEGLIKNPKKFCVFGHQRKDWCLALSWVRPKMVARLT